MLSCWEGREQSRPAFSQLVKTLEEFLASAAGYVDLTEFRLDDDFEAVQHQTQAEPNDYCIADTLM